MFQVVENSISFEKNGENDRKLAALKQEHQLSDVSNLIDVAYNMLAIVEAQNAQNEHEEVMDQDKLESAESLARENKNMVYQCARINNKMDEYRKNSK
jgi:hypothetical protein